MTTSLRSWVVPYREPNDHGSLRYVVLVRLEDGDGCHGWGEAVTLFREAAVATKALLDAWAPLLAQTSCTPTALRSVVDAHTWWYGGSGIACFALAALDTAAWDLVGRSAGRSVLDLLGGAAHPGLPLVVTTHAVLADLQEQAEVLAAAVAQRGAGGVKVGFGKAGEANLGFEHDRDVAFVRALRGAVGDGPRIIVDVAARARWDVTTAVRRVRAFEEHGLHWIEEPLGADDPEGYAELKARVSCLIGYGEREWTVRGIRRILATGTVDVVGIDAGRAEGITGFAQAAVHVAGHGRQANAHAFAGPISYAAGLAVSLSTPVCRQFEVAPLANELMTRLAPDLPQAVGAAVPLPGPGLGIDLDLEAVESMAAGYPGTGTSPTATSGTGTRGSDR